MGGAEPSHFLLSFLAFCNPRYATLIHECFLEIMKPEISLIAYFLRIAVIAFMFAMAYCLAEQDNPFFYQAF